MKLAAFLRSIALAVFAVNTFAQTTMPPFTDLLASYPWGPQTAFEATPDNRRGFVAAGAGLTVLDLDNIINGAPTVIERIEIPYCAPEAMVYHEPNATQHHLYVAAGTLGLWRVHLCSGLFQTTPSACGAAYYIYPATTRPVQMAVVDTTFQRKRCVDLCIVPNNSAAGAPLLFALFAAQENSPIGATELHAFRLDSSGGFAPYGPSTPLDFHVGTSPLFNAAGTAIAADPGDPNFVYVALGKGGMVRVDITTASFTYVPINRPSCALPSCMKNESVRDLSIVHTATQGSFLYAASEYKGVLEYRIPTGPTPTPLNPAHPIHWQFQTLALPFPYADRISATTTGGDYIFFAVATQSGPSVTEDTPAPHRNIGHWRGQCIGWYEPDPNFGGGAPQPGSEKVYWYDRDATVATFAPLQREVHPYGKWWGSLLLRPKSATVYRLYECSVLYATYIHELEFATGSVPPASGSPPTYTLLAQHVDWVCPAGDLVASDVNPDMTYFGPDGPSAPATSQAAMFFITAPPNEDIVPVAGTLVPCPALPPPSLGSACGEAANLYSSGLLATAHWRDPVDPNREWFMPGSSLSLKYDLNCGGTELECADPCNVYWRGFPSGYMGINSRQGWRVTLMNPSTVSPLSPPTIVKFWQLEAPSNQPASRSDDTPYVSSTIVPILNAHGYPVLVLLARGSSDFGFKVVRAEDLRPRTLNDYCNHNGTGSGVGELLYQALTPYYPKFAEGLTHPEFEMPAGGGMPCVPWVECAGAGTEHLPRAHYNTQCASFETINILGNPKHACVITAGFVAASPSAPASPPLGPQPTTCLWKNLYRRALIAIFDVHDAATSPIGSAIPAPTLLRYGVGPNPADWGETHAWAVRTKAYPSGQTYAFVTDVLGKLLVYDIGPGPLYSVPPPQDPTWPDLPLLTPVAVLAFPNDPSDGFNVNCTDIEIDGNFAYCACARAGVAIVDISNPTNPQLQLMLDTPGLALGIELRTNPHNGAREMIVGDGVCGMRVYGRTGTGNPP